MKSLFFAKCMFIFCFYFKFNHVQNSFINHFFILSVLFLAKTLNCCCLDITNPNYQEIMSSEEDKPPAPPVRLTSNRGGSDRGDSTPPVDLRPLPKGKNIFFLIYIDCARCLINLLLKLYKSK